VHNDELHSLCSSTYIIRVRKSRRTRWAGYGAHMAEIINAYKISVGKPEGTTTLRTPRCRREIKLKRIVRNRI